MLTPNNKYWIATDNYGVLKATYKEVGIDNKIGYFQCDLVDGYMVLNNGIHGYKERHDDDIEKPERPADHLCATKEQWQALGWQR